MAGIIGRTIKHRRSRKKNWQPNAPQPTAGAVLITGATVSGTVLTLEFDDVVYVDGTPGITTDVVGAVPVSAVATAPNTVAITFDNAIDLATTLNIPYRDGAIRNSSGGYVTSNTFPVAA